MLSKLGGAYRETENSLLKNTLTLQIRVGQCHSRNLALVCVLKSEALPYRGIRLPPEAIQSSKISALATG